MNSKKGVSSVAGGMWTTTQQTWHLKAGRSTYVCGNNREDTVDDSWQPDGRHYQTARDGRMKRSPARLVSDTTGWSETLRGKMRKILVPVSWTHVRNVIPVKAESQKNETFASSFKHEFFTTRCPSHHPIHSIKIQNRQCNSQILISKHHSRRNVG